MRDDDESVRFPDNVSIQDIKEKLSRIMSLSLSGGGMKIQGSGRRGVNGCLNLSLELGRNNDERPSPRRRVSRMTAASAPICEPSRTFGRRKIQWEFSPGQSCWRWIYWVLFFVGGMFLFTLVMPETLAPVLLKKEAAKLRKETGDPMYRTIKELEKKAFKEVVVIALLRPSIMLFTEPIIICMTLCHVNPKPNGQIEPAHQIHCVSYTTLSYKPPAL
ncbi:hypothetical protein K443DRAFT_123584 [Laccaria amethystina LaAM-08-1]|uniref:Uncharacterized protein n=1 Tax=Laccaria amethystina LaAM-08-1 TaxID=1095629 RepID=A0A0C9X0A0_9AGAR|nr:hypothetical protein K443DRAFT_123584 [Laccaria amethystina LaAM-08-1]